jgi:glycosyltransferase involved in cell wall biosynthesis
LPKISAVIVTLNEESNIKQAILSVKPWVDEIVVVDMMSDDRTVELARSLGAATFDHPRVGFVEPARLIAVDYARGEWILILDADEMISYSLSMELLRIVEHDSADVCLLPRLNYVLGKPMMHGQPNPDRDAQMRFFKRGTLQFSDKIHSVPTPEAGARVIKVKFAGNCAIHHFNSYNAAQLIDKMNRYTTIEAEQLFGQRKPTPTTRLLLWPVYSFMREYFIDHGWRDGWRGLYRAHLAGFYRLSREVKYLQFVECGQTTQCNVQYAHEVAELLHEYSPDAGK